MKRRSLVSLMMAGTLAMSLAGCSGGGNTGNEAKPSSYDVHVPDCMQRLNIFQD